jgi:twitching motility protein PilT
MEKGEREGRSLLDAIRDGNLDGMQSFDDELEALARKDLITIDAALAYASNQGNLRLALADLLEQQDRGSAVTTAQAPQPNDALKGSTKNLM